MPDQIPIKVKRDGSNNTTGLAEFEPTDTIPESVINYPTYLVVEYRYPDGSFQWNRMIDNNGNELIEETRTA